MLRFLGCLHLDQKCPQCCWEFHDNSSERPSPEPLFWKKRHPQLYWGGENSGNALEPSNALNYRAWGIPAALSRGIPGKALRAFPGSFRNFSGIFSGKSQPYWGCGPIYQGKKKEPKPKLFGPDIFRWGGGLLSERVGVKKFGMSLETQGNTCLARYLGIFPGYPGSAQKVWEKKVCVQFSSPNLDQARDRSSTHSRTRWKLSCEVFWLVLVQISVGQ